MCDAACHTNWLGGLSATPAKWGRHSCLPRATGTTAAATLHRPCRMLCHSKAWHVHLHHTSACTNSTRSLPLAQQHTWTHAPMACCLEAFPPPVPAAANQEQGDPGKCPSQQVPKRSQSGAPRLLHGIHLPHAAVMYTAAAAAHLGDARRSCACSRYQCG